ncbi:prolyl aminopeptidase [Oceanicella actignis]|uniref:prolyl aminopeptidase n=1 Tax=Oceanicella actignis TaxID=1189325 RepID=UPI0011E83893|nr:prolyl aminopeptidase [Oceanicella actignis]TYO89526.1 proline iminopeptidase [Oceanicella actignis]
MRESDNDPRARRPLHPPIEPFRTMRLQVPGGHDLYVEECGAPLGEPVVVLHGGPGGGCSPAMRSFFDPRRWRAVLFDQRGCGRSRPHASLEANTTWDLVADIERIREALGIERWTVFGGSWGATLALLYAQAHPERVAALVLRGVFLMTRRELDWFYGGGAGLFRPEAWSRFVEAIPEDERGDLIAAYYRRLTDPDTDVQTAHARLWAGWEAACATLRGGGGAPDGAYARAFSRIEAHYFAHGGWLEEDGQILRDAGRLRGIPGHIVQGRYDLICPPVSAWALNRAWPESRLHMVPDAGHALSEPGIAGMLVRIMDELETR